MPIKPLASTVDTDGADSRGSSVRNISDLQLHHATTTAATAAATASGDTSSSTTAPVTTTHSDNQSSSTAVSVADHHPAVVSLTRNTDSSHRSPSGLSAFNVSALRSRLRQHRAATASAKSVGSRTSLSSQPVLVRSYSGAITHNSGPSSLYGTSNSIQPQPVAPAAFTEQPAPGFRAVMPGSRDPVPAIPPVSAFSFSHVLLTVELDIQDSLDAISEICARSRLSLADEYGAHLPPQGEIGGLAQQLALRSRQQGLFVRTAGLADSALSIVQEASSSSGSEAGGRRSAYGSLRSVLSKGRQRKTPHNNSMPGNDVTDTGSRSMSWAIRGGGKNGIVLVGRPKPSRHISMDPLNETAHDDLIPASMSPSLSLPPDEVPDAAFIRPWKMSRGHTGTRERVSAQTALRSLLLPSSIPAEALR